MKSLFLFTFVLITFSAHSNVKIVINGMSHEYVESPRLSEVLSPIAEQENWYWPASGVYRSDSQKQESQKRQVLADINTTANNHAGLQSTLNALKEQVSNWSLSLKVNLDIDYDKARLIEHANPKFEAGEYLITLTLRPDYITVFGAVSNNNRLSYKDGQCLYNYVEQMQRNSDADPDYVYVIQPDGKIIKPGVAYWNKQCLLVMPGSQIYVPLRENLLFSDIQDLNRSIADLAVNRIEVQ